RGNRTRATAPPLQRLLNQAEHTHALVHLGLSFFLPSPPPGGAAAAEGESLIGQDAQGRPVLTVPFSVDEYLALLGRTIPLNGPPGVNGVAPVEAQNSATLRAVCDCCRLILLKDLFASMSAPVKGIFQAWAGKHHHAGLFADPD